ncbi:MAG TPA: beta-glucosidase BglX, partial [Verrucomicrobiae bacterium]|nr:beta-glucosidase BglX [Verrucomicrobiae bacterium]
KYSLVIFLAALVVASASPATIYHGGWIDLNKNDRKDVYEDPTQRPEKRVADLLQRMTLDEKIGQLFQAYRESDAEATYGGLLRQGKVGSFLDGSELIENPALRNRLQRIDVEESRLGIPLIFGTDSIHGFRTIFPIPLAEACAWEPELFEATQAISARETAAVGIDWTFAPMVDLARDPRWGRIAEGFGEDPYLGSLYAAAGVRGFQGTNPADPDRVIACLKHYVGYGAVEGGRDYNTTEISEYTLRNFYLPQFKAGVEAGAWTVMSAFNCLSGTPASANHHTLTDILKNEWGFQGFVVSDWAAVNELISQGVAANPAQAARLALTAGVDMEMLTTNYLSTLKQQVLAGTIKEKTIDEAVTRVLRVKFARGLFERPYVDESLSRTAFLKPDALALARKAVVKSCVLLKNGNNTLPLSRQLKRIAVIGPLGDDTDNLLGSWCARGRSGDVVSIAAGIRAKLASTAELKVVHGCELPEVERNSDGSLAPKNLSPSARREAEFSQAVDAVRAADVVIMALGEPKSWSGENASRSRLDLPGDQLELFKAIAGLGKPVVVILINGRPLALPEIQDQASAILEAWDPGVQGGNGIADLLFGDADPEGRLAVSIPYDVGQVPVYYNHLNTGRPQQGEYVDGPRDPLYPFGFGLTYTTFKYGEVKLSATTMKSGGTITASVNLTNTGSRPGIAVVQLYIRDIISSAGPRPVRELKGFRKVRLTPGESQDARFTIPAAGLGSYDRNGRWLVEPGKFQIWLTKDSASGKPAEFELIGRN